LSSVGPQERTAGKSDVASDPACHVHVSWFCSSFMFRHRHLPLFRRRRQPSRSLCRWIEAADGNGLTFQVGPSREEIVRAELDEYTAGILVDQHVELGQNLFRAVPINGRPASQRLTNRWFARGGVLWDRPPVRKRLAFATLAVSNADRQPDGALASSQPRAARRVRSPRGDLAAATWDEQEGALTVSRGSGTRVTITCAADACRRDPIRWPAWRPGADQIVFATADRARVQTIHLWDLPSGELRTLWEGRGLLSGGTDPEAPCAVGAAFVACVEAAPASPPRLMLLDLARSEARAAHDPNEGLRARAWLRHERLTWEGKGGQVYTGIMFLPPQDARQPAPLFAHYYQCDGFVRGGVGDEWPFAALAAAGVVSVCVNMTRGGASDDGVGRYRAAQEGVRSLIDLLAGRGLIDPDRVGMGGLSFGSEVTMWMLMHTDLIAAASVASPQFEPANYWFNNVRGRDHRDVLRRYWGLGAPDQTPQQWRLLSPALNVDRIGAPLLLQLPEQEARYAVELYARLSNSPTPTKCTSSPMNDISRCSPGIGWPSIAETSTGSGSGSRIMSIPSRQRPTNIGGGGCCRNVRVPLVSRPAPAARVRGSKVEEPKIVVVGRGSGAF